MPTLQWVTRDVDVTRAEAVPYRLLEPVAELGAGDPTTGNMLIQGDNLDALKALLPYYAGRVKCIYIDPPFNTGAAFPNYADHLPHSEWLGFMFSRLVLLRDLLTPDGVICVQLDDTEAHYLKVLMDEVFGRDNYINTLVVSTNKAFGFKSTSDGLFRQTNFLSIYGRDRAKVRLREDVLLIEKGYDSQYKWVFENVGAPETAWTWRNIADVVATQLGFENSRVARRSNPDALNRAVAHFALENHERVFRTASVSGGALAKRRATIAHSKQVRDRIVRHPDDDMDYRFIAGERVLMYSERLREVDGRLVPAEIATDLWTDIPVEGLAAEGGVDFPKGKKPERLLRRVIGMSTAPGDLVLDSFLGSGTTAAVAHKMGRRWIGIEMGDHAVTHCVPRLRKVIEGEQGGVSQAVGWTGGGGFTFHRLGEPVFDETGALRPGIPFRVLAAHIWFSEADTRAHAQAHEEAGPFLGVVGEQGLALLYNGVLGDRRPAGGNVLTSATLAAVRAAAGGFDGPLTIYGEASRLGPERLRAERVTFKQTPYDVRTR